MMFLTIFDTILEFLKAHLGRFIATGVVIVVTFVVILIIKLLIRSYKKRSKNKRAVTLMILIRSIIRYILVIIAIIVIMSIWGIEMTGVIAGAGILGLVIGLGAQSLIQDFLSGISIVFEDHYEIGEIVEIKGFKGRVVELGLRSTKLINFKGELKIFNNGDIKEITNFSRNHSLALVEVSVAYKENLERVINILQERLATFNELFPQIIEGPNVAGVTNLGDSGISIRVTAKTETEQHYPVERALRKYIKEVFDENGIEIPFPQVVVHNERKFV